MGILLFCSPGFWDVGGLLRALSSLGGQLKVFKSIVGKGNVSFEDLDNLNDEERTYLHGIAKASNLLFN